LIFTSQRVKGERCREGKRGEEGGPHQPESEMREMQRREGEMRVK
jgi:hypothetical protein